MEYINEDRKIESNLTDARRADRPTITNEYEPVVKLTSVFINFKEV